MATFLGRPPLMARRYSDRKLPLDLDNSISTTDPNTLEEAISKLDSEGWNTEGKMYNASWIRLRYHTAILKERVLEQSLAAKADDDIIEKLQYVFSPFHACAEHTTPLLTHLLDQYPQT